MKLHPLEKIQVPVHDKIKTLGNRHHSGKLPSPESAIGDGLMGMKCEAKEHAKLKPQIGLRVRHADRGWGVVQHAGQTISRVRFESDNKTLACRNVDLHA